MGLPAIPYSSATPTTTTKTRRSLNLKNTMICPTRGHDFSNLHWFLNPLNRAKQCFVLFGLMAVSLTCLHVFSGGSGLRRRLPDWRELRKLLEKGEIPTAITVWRNTHNARKECCVHFKLKDGLKDVNNIRPSTVLEYFERFPKPWKSLAINKPYDIQKCVRAYGGNDKFCYIYLEYLR